jgi:hypothetical protein
MKKDEISAIDAIYEVLEKTDLLEKRLSVIEDNLKLLNNKISKFNKNIATSTEAVLQSDTAIQRESVQAPQQREPEVLVLGNIKVYGYIVNRDRMPIEGVVINVYDKNNRLVKNVTSDMNGYWESRLPSGKYGVEYIHKKFKPINKSIQLDDGIKTFEVR